jgi:hypothetical protein
MGLFKRNPFGHILFLKTWLIRIAGFLTHRRYKSFNTLHIEGSEVIRNLPDTNVLFISNHQTYFADVVAMFHVFNASLKGRENNIKNVTLQIKTNNAVRVLGKASQIVKFTEPDEKMAYFNLNVGNVTGIGKVQIIATSGKEKSTYDVEIDVMNPNPITTTYTDIIIEPNSSKKISWQSKRKLSLDSNILYVFRCFIIYILYLKI